MQNDPILTPIFTTLLVTAGLPTVIAGTSISVASVLSAATLAAGAFALSAYQQQPEAPKPEQGMFPLRQPLSSRTAGFGEVRMAGSYVCYELTDAGGHSFDVLALCQGPAGGFKQFYLDDEVPTVNPTTGQCNEFLGLRYQRCWLQARRGVKLETAIVPNSPLAIWGNNRRGDRVAQLSLFCTNVAASSFLTIYPHGLPKPSAVVFLPCWDFRDPNQNPDDADTWTNYPQWSPTVTYSAGARVLHGGVTLPGVAGGGMLYICIVPAILGGEPPPQRPQSWAPVWKNPVLQAVTYLISQDFGMGLPRDKLITPSLSALAAQAAICQEPVQLDSGAFETRYASCPWFKLDTEPAEVLALIMGSCDGWLSLDGSGALAAKVGKFEPPTVTLDESDIISVDLSYGVPDETKIDELQLTYTSPANGYTTQATDPWRDDDTILNRGRVRSNSFGPASVQSASQVRRLAKRVFLRANAMRGSIVTHLGGMRAAGQRYIQVRYPLIPELGNIALEIRKRETDIANRQCRFEFVVVDGDLLEGWVPAEEEPDQPPAPLPPPTLILPVPQNVTTAAVTGPPFLIRVQWDDPQWPTLQYMVRWRSSTAPGSGIYNGPFIQLTIENPEDLGTRLQANLPGATAGVDYQIFVATMGAGGTLSEWSVPSYIGTPASGAGFPSLDYSDKKNSAKWLYMAGF